MYLVGCLKNYIEQAPNFEALKCYGMLINKEELTNWVKWHDDAFAGLHLPARPKPAGAQPESTTHTSTLQPFCAPSQKSGA